MNELQGSIPEGYELTDRLKHSEIITFVQKNLARWTPSTVIYILVNMLIVGLLVFQLLRSSVSLDSAFSGFGLGIFLTLLLIPFHEWIHGLVYTTLGARNVKYKADFRKFVFYAMADKFVISGNQLRLVAIAPFLVITTIIVSVLFAVDGQAIFFLLGVLLFHTGACSGDFGLMSYVDKYEGKMVTFDDEIAGESYFFTKS